MYIKFVHKARGGLNQYASRTYRYVINGISNVKRISKISSKNPYTQALQSVCLIYPSTRLPTS